MKSRDFYGPLKLSESTREGASYDKSFFEHPEYPDTKIIRPVPDDLYVDDAEKVTQREALDVMTADAAQFGVSIVLVDYVQDKGGEILQIAERVPNAVDVKDLLDSRSLNDDQAAEINTALGNLAAYVESAVVDSEGKLLNEEMLHLAQAVYSPDLPKGKRVVIVDTEPFATDVIKTSEAASPNEAGWPTVATRLTAYLVKHGIELHQSGYELSSESRIAHLIDSLQVSTPESQGIVDELHTALATKTVTKGVINLSERYAPVDNPDDEYEDW